MTQGQSSSSINERRHQALQDLDNGLILSCELPRQLSWSAYRSAPGYFAGEVTLSNASAHTLTEVQLTATSSPCYFQSKVWLVPELLPGSHAKFYGRDLQFDEQYLGSLDECQQSTVTLQLSYTAGNGEQIVSQSSHKVTLLSENEWNGFANMGELLPIFVRSDEKAVVQLTNEARLRSPEKYVQGYRHQPPAKVKATLHCICQTLADAKLAPTPQQSHYNKDVQRLLPPKAIIQGDKATSLDFALLLAAMCEQMDLHPLVILYRQYALAGLWLKPQLVLDALTMTRPEVLRYQVQQGNLAIIDPQCLARLPLPDVDTLLHKSASVLSSNYDQEFLSAYDIHLARQLAIHPLGRHEAITYSPDSEHERALFLDKYSHAAQGKSQEQSSDFRSDVILAPNVYQSEMEWLANRTYIQDPQERLQHNRSRLLNLTPANPLLSLQTSNGPIEGVLIDCASLRQYLSEDQGLVPKSLSTWGSTEEGAKFPPLSHPLQAEAVQAALDNGHIFVDCPAEELEDKILRLHHIEQSERQSQGISSVYMAFLFVNWSQDHTVNRAPLFLLPLTLRRDEKVRCWTIQPVSSDLWLNSNVVELLRQHYKLDVSLLRPQLSACAREGNLKRAKELLDKAFSQRTDLGYSEDVVLGSFPLHRFQTWMDLERLTASLQSPRLQAIITGKPETTAADPMSKPVIPGSLRNDAPGSPRNDVPGSSCSDVPSSTRNGAPTSTNSTDGCLSSELPPDQLCPWPSDHYQAQVVNAAQAGRDLVLFSPPGTGKSHTLANLICNKLGQGKKVLLVSKHRNTLRTVYSLLRSVKLDAFCLYLPSPRTSDSKLLERLRRAWQAKVGEQETPSLESHPFAQTIAKMRQLDDSLNSPRKHGSSVNELICQTLREQGLPEPAFTLSWANHEAHSAEDLKEMHRLVEGLARQRAAFSGPTMHVLKEVKHAAWSSKWQNDMLEALHTLREQNARLDNSMGRLWRTLGYTLDMKCATARERTFELCALLQDCAGKPVAFALDIDAAQRLDMLIRLANHADAYLRIEAQLSCAYLPQSWQNLAGRRIPERWQMAKRTWWPKRIFVKRKIVKEVKQGGALNDPDISNDGPLFDRMCSEAQEMIELNHALRIPGIWHGFETPPAEILAFEQLGSRLRNFVAGLSDTPELMVALKDQLRTLLQEQPDSFLPQGSIGRNIQECYSLCQSLHLQFGALQRLAGLNFEEKLKKSSNQSDDINRLCSELLDQSRYWQAWCKWCESRERANSLGLGPLLKALDQGAISCEQALPQFKRAYMAWWLKTAVQRDEQLREFNGHSVNEWQKLLLEEESSWRQAVAQKIAEKISGNIPAFDGPDHDEDWTALRKELERPHGLKSAAHLWAEIPGIITALTPCLLMTPATVSQFLSSHMEPFDTVIMAEASQISVEEALSSCARGKQMIVVGDPRQMAPIFDSCSGQEESILDKFLQKGTAVHMLRHNYQAQDELLMAFANFRYYAGQIHTIPAPIYNKCKLQQVVIDGEYDAATKTNRSEAEAVVKAIMYRLHSKDPEVRNKSMGVITLSRAQRQLITAMLEQEFEGHPELDWALDGTPTIPPIIVRYLENCQGEYRDVVFLCLTYGWDTEGQFSMDFGPLNRVYGSHLFNVAITRAREEMVICSNFQAADIFLDRTQTVALADLKEFLTFVESELDRDRFASPYIHQDDVLLNQVAQALTEKGWIIKRNLGMSPLRLGLVVVNPDDSRSYLACILGDGMFYRNSRSAEERYYIQPKQLGRMGWKALRVWALDWWNRREDTLENLHQRLIKILRNQRAHSRN